LKSLKRKPGDIAYVQDKNRWILYLVTKPRYFQKPNPLHLQIALEKLKLFCTRNKIKHLAMPRIGCGLDGLSWEITVRPMIKRTFAEIDTKIIVYALRNSREEWNQQKLKSTLISALKKHWNRGYRQEVMDKFGNFQNYKGYVFSDKFVPGRMEIRLWAEIFFRRIPIVYEDKEEIVGCRYAEMTPKLTLEKDRLKREKQDSAPEQEKEERGGCSKKEMENQPEDKKPRSQEERLAQHINSVMKVEQISDSKSNLFSVWMKVDGKKQKVTVDTAASKSLISIELVRDKTLLPSKFCLMSASDGQLKLLGEYEITLQAEGQSMTHRMLVHNQESPALRVLLGNDFHDKFKTNTCFLRNQFSIPLDKGRVVLHRIEYFVDPRRETCLCLQESTEANNHDSPIKIVAKDELRIRQGESKKIKVTFNPIKPTSRSYFEPRQVLGSRIISWDMIFEPDDSNVWVTNASEEDLTVKPGTMLGFLRGDVPVRVPKESCTHDLLKMWKGARRMSQEQICVVQDGKPAKEEFDVNPELTEKEQEDFRNMLKRNEDVFVRDGEPLRTTNVLKVRLPLKDENRVIYQHNYALSPVQDKAASEVISKMLEEGVLESASHSNYRIPFFLVEKGQDENNVMQYRLVLSAKKLNECLSNINYAPPQIPHILAQLKGKDFFSTLDLSSSFHQLEIHPDDRNSHHPTRRKAIFVQILAARSEHLITILVLCINVSTGKHALSNSNKLCG